MELKNQLSSITNLYIFRPFSSTHLFLRFTSVYIICTNLSQYKKKRKELQDLMTVINYFEEHLLNNFLLTGTRRYSENANVECYKHTIHPNSITASAMISLTFTNSFFLLSVFIHNAKKAAAKFMSPPIFQKMSKQLVIHKPKEF